MGRNNKHALITKSKPKQQAEGAKKLNKVKKEKNVFKVTSQNKVKKAKQVQNQVTNVSKWNNN